MPAWIPRLLLWIVVTAFLAYAAFSLIRRLQQLLLWLIAAPITYERRRLFYEVRRS